MLRKVKTLFLPCISYRFVSMIKRMYLKLSAVILALSVSANAFAQESDSVEYKENKEKAIKFAVNKNINAALPLLTSCYQKNMEDKEVQTMISASLISIASDKANLQGSLDTINSWTAKFPFLKDDKQVRKVYTINANQLTFLSFQEKNIEKSLAYHDIVIEELSKNQDLGLKDNKDLISMAVNLAADQFEKKEFRNARKIASESLAYFNDPELKKMLKYMDDKNLGLN
ncbi:hypothetical protein [Sphingobacterium cellulitidis]|uniref:hypothetical protein n=1 Tax=Sphingobacterium cellulitidis TaxID=1768011 RepID=UPI001181C1B4|nr:hypothetical protein [Sphingobacterium cellulitidis]